MTQEIRQWIVRRREDRPCGRNAVWKKLKRRTSEAIKKRKKGYSWHLKKKFMTGHGKNGFHHCVKVILNGNTADRWNVRSLYPEATAEKLADYFNGISTQYEPLTDEKIPITFD